MGDTTSVQQQMFEAWNRRDFAAIRRVLHPAYSYTGPDGQTLAGPDAGIQIAKLYAEAFPDAVLRIDRTYSLGDTCIVEMTAIGTHGGSLFGVPASGKPVTVQICNVMEIRGGKIYREREYMDMLTIMRQIGAAPVTERGASA